MGNVPSYNYRPIAVTTPAGTAIATPQSTPFGPFVGQLVNAEIQIPPGHAGLTGISIQANGQSYVPFGNGSLYIVADGYTNTFDIDIVWIYPLTIVTYNTDVYPHTHYLRLKVDLTQSNAQPASQAAAMVVA